MTRFGVFDPKAEVARTERFLPHWFQPGAATFLTFRTFDSMPAKVVANWHAEIKAWLAHQGVSLSSQDDQLPEVVRLPRHLRPEYYRIKNRGWQARLDRCHGECLLRDAKKAMIVADALELFDGQRYDLASYVVMPNHVHVILQFRPGWKISKVTDSWLRYTARKINAQIGRKGRFWQGEPFDHLIRSVPQFEYLLRYVRENPTKAGLKAGEYIVAQASDW